MPVRLTHTSAAIHLISVNWEQNDSEVGVMIDGAPMKCLEERNDNEWNKDLDATKRFDAFKFI